MDGILPNIVSNFVEFSDLEQKMNDCVVFNAGYASQSNFLKNFELPSGGSSTSFHPNPKSVYRSLM